jgi:ABC-type Mn2+/Zn2+ transport system permease subunit
VIQEFLASWSLFGDAYLVGLASALVLGLLGVWVVARDQIFLGAAVSQASTLGVAVALWLGAAGASAHDHERELLPAALAVAASVATAWLAGRAGQSSRGTGDAVTGWVFLFASSVPVLMVAHSPQGTEEIERLVFSTLLSVSRGDLLVFAALAVGAVGAAALLRERLLLLAIDPELATAVGLHPGRWRAGLALALGVAVGLSIHAAGTLYTFGCLVLPALAAKQLCREMRPLLWVSPLIAMAAALLGFAFAHHLDWPPAHTTVALLAVALPAAWAWRAWRTQRAAVPPPPA